MRFIEANIKQIEEELYNFAVQRGSILSKKDVDLCSVVPSYNTCVRKGLKLTNLNKRVRESLYSLNSKHCKYCNFPISFERRQYHFCGHSCSAKFNNANRAKKDRAPTETKALHPKVSIRSSFEKCGSNCLWCGDSLSNKRHRQAYCSSGCHKSDRYASEFLDWYHHGAYRPNRVLRQFLTTWKGYRCEVCNISSWNNKEITLEVEHVDGNSGNPSPENVCLICPNCHSQTSTYKGRNKGNGRHERLVRYHEGKSY